MQQNNRLGSKPDGTSKKTDGADSTSAATRGVAVVGSVEKRDSQCAASDKLPRSSKEGKTDESSSNGGTSNGHREGSQFSYWGANLTETKDERELYDEEIDQGRQKKVSPLYCEVTL